jgi:hypothetical protein
MNSKPTSRICGSSDIDIRRQFRFTFEQLSTTLSSSHNSEMQSELHSQLFRSRLMHKIPQVSAVDQVVAWYQSRKLLSSLQNMFVRFPLKHAQDKHTPLNFKTGSIHGSIIHSRNSVLCSFIPRDPQLRPKLHINYQGSHQMHIFSTSVFHKYVGC